MSSVSTHSTIMAIHAQAAEAYYGVVYPLPNTPTRLFVLGSSVILDWDFLKYLQIQSHWTKYSMDRKKSVFRLVEYSISFVEIRL